MFTRPKNRAGITILEILVSISISGLLVSLMLPAIQASREGARRAWCCNNLKQIGLALHNYESTFGRFPPSFLTSQHANRAQVGASWSIHGRLLPYVEQGPAFQNVDLDVDWHDQVTSGITSTQIPTYLCPSETNNQIRFKHGSPYVAPVSYGFNMGTWFIYDPNTGRVGDGAFVVNRGTRPAEVLDGLSHTLAVSEVKTYQPYLRNTADPGAEIPVSSAKFATLMGDFRETGHTVWPDGRTHHAGFTTVFPPNHKVVFITASSEFDIDYTSQQEGKSATQATFASITARSHHPGVVNAVLMDGSVQSISSNIDSKTWRAIGTRMARETNTFAP